MRTSPDPRQFTLNPASYGLPTREDLVAMRIWDIHYHGLEGGNLAGTRRRSSTSSEWGSSACCRWTSPVRKTTR